MKQCCLDPIPTRIVKQCSDILAPIVTIMANMSFARGVFPDGHKHAIVTPLLKKPGLDSFDQKSYRPISNLTFLSKLVERLSISRLNQHISTNSLLSVHQSAYRSNHSTETAVAAIFNNIARAIDAGKICALVLLDMSAAFNTVDHTLLLRILQERFGVQDEALSWFTSYLHNRTQSVHIGSNVAEAVKLDCGVPQGSVIGPAEFNIYTEQVGEVIQQHKLDHHMYADDIQLLATMFPTDIDQYRTMIENCVMSVHDWCSARRLTLNPDKTEVIWFGSRANLGRIQNCTTSLHFDTIDITPAETVRDLGVVLDSRLDMHACTHK